MSDDHKLVKLPIRTAGGALAYTPGMTITTAAVEANGWQDYVVGRDTQEARTLLAEITGDPIEEPKTRSTRAAASTTTSSTEE